MAETGYKIAANTLPDWHSLYSDDTNAMVDMSQVALYKKDLDNHQFPAEKYIGTVHSDYTDFKQYALWTNNNSYPWFKYLPHNLYTYQDQNENTHFLLNGTAPGFYTFGKPSLRFRTTNAGHYSLTVTKNSSTGLLNLTIYYDYSTQALQTFSNCPYNILFVISAGGGGGGGGDTGLGTNYGGGGGGGGAQAWGILSFPALFGRSNDGTSRYGNGFSINIGAGGSGGAGAGWGDDARDGSDGEESTLFHASYGVGITVAKGSKGIAGNSAGGAGGSGGVKPTYSNSYFSMNGIYMIDGRAGGNGGAGAAEKNTGSRGSPSGANNIEFDLGGQVSGKNGSGELIIVNGVGKNSGVNYGRGGGGAGISISSTSYGYGGNGGRPGGDYSGSAGDMGGLFLYW